MKKDIKYTLRIFLLVAALWFGAVSQVLAQSNFSFSNSDITITGSGTVVLKPEGGIVADTDGKHTVTLTITPSEGYYIKASDIVVEKLVDPGKANAPERRTPAFADVIPGTMYSGSGRTDDDIISSVSYPNSAQYVFKVPADYDGAYATATFHLETEGNIIRITSSTNLGDTPDMTARYILVEDVDAEVVKKFNSSIAFTGIFEGEAKADGSFPKIMNLKKPLFNTATNATIRNINLDEVSISQSGKVGSIACTANGSTRIYNCGILSGSVGSTGTSTANNETDCCGGLVGFLDGTARVINCYSYATITGGNRVGGIVGFNNNQTTSASDNLKTMVMNCMFYGDITGGYSKAPVYHGRKIVNAESTAVGNYNYFSADAPYVKNKQIDYYYCALMAETRFLQRFEFYRYLLNSHRELAAWWATGDRANKDLMAKWVLEPSQIGSEHPYPILKAPGYYPSVVNIDAKNATTQAERNKGGKLGTLAVNIRMGDGEQFEHPAGATITKPYLTLNITDKDYDHFNFNYYKVQLPYYNDVGTKNYTGQRVVTGWKIVSITGGTPGTFTTGSYDATVDTDGKITSAPYNFADRKCTNKDLYGSGGSNRVFSQGAYWDVPEGVTAITIEPYWAKAAYVADAYADVVYNTAMTTAYNVPNVGGGQIYTNGESTFKGDDQPVYTTIANAVTALDPKSNHTVNDYAVVLVGNYHEYSGNAQTIRDGKPYTVTSVDLDGDNEPDYSFMWRFDGRTKLHAVKYDFLNLIGLGMAQKSTSSKGSYNFGIPSPLDWFEVTNTALFRVTQMEYSPANRVKKPIIMQGGVIEQWVTQQQNAGDKVEYFHVGGNVWFKEFHRGSHQDNAVKSPSHPPLSVTGGDFEKFYLTGAYQPLATNYNDDAECYINGGRFGIVAGAGMDGIGDETKQTKGNIIWQIDNADINEFYGGGINGEKSIQGNITTVIRNSHVGLFCGGPKFGDMNAGRTVKTTATDCHFGTYFGAGYGGNSYYRAAPANFSAAGDTWKSNDDKQYNLNWNQWVAGTIKANLNSGNYSDGTAYTGYNQDYISAFGGVSVGFDYQFIPMSNNSTNVARLFIDFVSFSLATTRHITSKLTGCTITGNFYGGGNLGKVEGPVSSTLTDCKVDGNVFGAGYSASLPTISVMPTSGFKDEPSYDKETAVFMPGTLPDYEPDVYHWEYAETVNSTATAIDKEKHILYTTKNLNELGVVTGKVTLNIEGTTTVGKSVYGGGEESGVGGDTEVNVTGGTIGTAGKGGAEYGNVYGGGKGKADEKLAGLVKGDTKVTVENTGTGNNMIVPFIRHNVYGGGAYGSVGEFEYADAAYHAEHPEVAVGAPKARKTGTNGGTTNVIIKGGTIGTNGENNGMVFGSSRGDVAKPDVGDEVDPNDRLAWVYDTNVTIGTQSETPDLANPQIRGSIYGSGENGHTFNDTHVKVHSGTIGIESGSPITDEESRLTYEGPRYPYRGNVYGGGCGTDRYSSGKTDSQGNEFNDMFNFLAGIVLGNTNVEIDGGHIIHNVYGGGAMGSVGTYTTFADEAYVAAQAALDKEVPLKKPLACKDGTGLCKVTVTGGEIGTKNMKMDKTDGPDDFGHVFGGGRGDALDPDNYKNIEICAYFGSTELTIKGKAFVRGSVYGGSESGHVLGNTNVVIGGDNEGDNECQIGGGDGVENAYSSSDWETESMSLKPTHHWNYIDDGAPYDQFARENGKYTTGKSAEGGFMVATDGHTFYGNVFAGGSGYYPFAPGEWLFSAGCVEGSATLIIKGGHILNNVYGGCEMSDVLGDVSVTMTGGTVGVPRTKGDILLNPAIGHIYGAGMGDKRIFFNTVTNVQNSNVTVSGGRVYGSVHGGGEDGHVLNNATTTISGNVVIGSVTDGTTSGFDGNVFGGGQGSPTALTAGTVGGNVELNIQGGTMHGSVYGGGRIASVGTFFELAKIPVNPNDPNSELKDNPDYGKMQDGTDHGYITVNLKGGEIFQNVYGGCMGTRGMAAVDQVRFAVSKNVTVELNKDVLDTERGCIVKGSIFGCNNVNSSPQENVTVHVYATQNAAATQIANTPASGTEGQEGYKPAVTNAKEKGRFDVKAVYGGGNMAAYLPKGPDATDNNYDGKNTTYSTHVIIDGCERTSIGQVYGGGNAASTPATEVTVNGTFEIDELFGGGNGADRITYNEGVSYQDNPGANVGFYDYSAEEDTYNTKEKRTTDEQTSETFKEKYVYGTGKAAVNVFGGLINHVFGGSNTKGNVRETAITLLEEKQGTEDCCPFNVGEVYGGGKSAPMDADAKIYMACIPGLKAAYGGAEAADIQGGVTLNITNGTFDRVFGGNNISGTIRGPIEVNIEEIGCRPIIIGELYGGGNLAPYSVYGYNDNGTIKESGTTKAYKDPVVNVKSFTSIGSVYGGGYGSTAVMVGDPTVNINVALGGKASESSAEIGKDGTDWKDMAVKDGQLVEKTVEGSYPIPYHKTGVIGAITNVFGGGNAAEVIGKTSVNIGTRVGEDEYMAVIIKEGETLPTLPEGEKYYTRTGTAPNYTYTETNHTKAQEGVTYYKKYVIKGVDIRGNVYGGGNNADVTGDTNVIIGK